MRIAPDAQPQQYGWPPTLLPVASIFKLKLFQCFLENSDGQFDQVPARRRAAPQRS
jgi:hypothetical protein